MTYTPKKTDSCLYNPRTRRAYELMDPEQEQEFFNEIRILNGYDPARPFYVLSRNNHHRTLEGVLERDFREELDRHQSPLIGIWKDVEMASSYYTILYPLQTKKAAVREAKRLRLDQVVRVTPEGKTEFVGVRLYKKVGVARADNPMVENTYGPPNNINNIVTVSMIFAGLQMGMFQFAIFPRWLKELVRDHVRIHVELTRQFL